MIHEREYETSERGSASAMVVDGGCGRWMWLARGCGRWTWLTHGCGWWMWLARGYGHGSGITGGYGTRLEFSMTFQLIVCRRRKLYMALLPKSSNSISRPSFSQSSPAWSLGLCLSNSANDRDGQNPSGK